MDKNKKQDYLVKTLIFQFVICALIFGFIFFINYFDTPAFSVFKNELDKLYLEWEELQV